MIYNYSYILRNRLSTKNRVDSRTGHVVEGEGGVDVVDAVEDLVEAQVVRQADP